MLKAPAPCTICFYIIKYSINFIIYYIWRTILLASCYFVNPVKIKMFITLHPFIRLFSNLFKFQDYENL